ncbi:holo-ACP synthase AcpS [Tomitella biformata]|uniref:holo-ACP synthase AcpS n=1 Tax=Tomitella biformata TaxID=630403 RepID=UPI000466B476|nr:holo-ACP synthase [Tomitella biformata]
MILGIGLDVVAVSEFAEQLGRPGSAIASSFTSGERRDCAGRGAGLRDEAAQAKHFAARWAAKEAVIKAWSGGNFGGAPALESVRPQDIEVRTDAWGRPSIRLHGEVAVALGDAVIHLSLTHDGDMAAAYVVIERL